MTFFITAYTTVVTRDTNPVLGMTSVAATHTIAATAFFALFRNRCSEPRVSPASTCDRCWVLRLCMGYPPPASLPPRVCLSHVPHSRWQHCIAPTAMPTHTLATLYCPHRDAHNTLATLYCPRRDAPILFLPRGKHHRDHCHCHCFFPMGDTTVIIVSAAKETPPPPDPFHYREEHYSLWGAPCGT